MRTADTRPLAVLLACCLGATTQAQGLSPLTFEAGYSTQRDDNLFRLSDGANTQALLGRSSAAEQIDIRSLGMNFDKSWSLQNLRLNYRVVDYQYKNFSYLDFTALNYSMAWRWAVTPSVTGTLSGSEQEVQSSFSDFQGYSTRNTRTDRNRGFNLRAEIDGLWSVLASLSSVLRLNQQPVLAGNDYKGVVTELGAQYERPGLSSAKAVVRQTDGSFLNRSLSSSSEADNRFIQTNYEFSLRRAPGGWSDASLMLGYVDRRHPNLPQRDFAGGIGRAALTFSPDGKVSTQLGYSYDRSDFVGTTTNYVAIQRRNVGLTWRATELSTVSVRHSRFSGNFGASLTSSVDRVDEGRESVLSFGWQPDRRLAITASMQKTARTSTQSTLNFASHLASLSVQAYF